MLLQIDLLHPANKKVVLHILSLRTHHLTLTVFTDEMRDNHNAFFLFLPADNAGLPGLLFHFHPTLTLLRIVWYTFYHFKPFHSFFLILNSLKYIYSPATHSVNLSPLFNKTQEQADINNKRTCEEVRISGMEPNTKGAATFYQYKLIKKITITAFLLRVYLVLPLVCLVLESVFLSWLSVLFMIIAGPVMLWIQYVISRSVLLISGHPIAKRWRLSLRLPWPGYMPDQYINYGIFRTVQLHNLWIGLCIAALFILWAPPAFTASLAVCHLWLLLPRLYTLLRLNSVAKDGMLKFNAADASYYAQ